MLSKLGSAHKKPNQQTIIRNRAVQKFLSEFKFTKIRGLGGKLGEQITSEFNTDTVKDLLPISIEQLKLKLGDETGTWVYQIIRGNDYSEVNSRTQIKSMLSAKSFRPSINTPDQAQRWLRIFAADIYSRLVEEGVLENKRRPKTINLHHRQGGQTKSRQGPIPSGKKIDESGLYELAKNLLGQIILEGRVWPCSNLSLSVGGFEDGISGNMGIGAFLVKGDVKVSTSTRESGAAKVRERPEKRRRIEPPAGIGKFSLKTDSTDEHDEDFGAHLSGADSLLAERQDVNENEQAALALPGEDGDEATKTHDHHIIPYDALSHRQQSITEFLCPRCSQALGSTEDLQSHQDWHLAKDLQDEDRGLSQPKLPTTSSSKKTAGNSNKKKATRGRQEKGQSKLTFG